MSLQITCTRLHIASNCKAFLQLRNRFSGPLQACQDYHLQTASRFSLQLYSFVYESSTTTKWTQILVKSKIIPWWTQLDKPLYGALKTPRISPVLHTKYLYRLSSYSKNDHSSTDTLPFSSPPAVPWTHVWRYSSGVTTNRWAHPLVDSNDALNILFHVWFSVHRMRINFKRCMLV